MKDYFLILHYICFTIVVVLSDSDNQFDFQCLIDIITNSGSHTISTASLISSQYLVISAHSLSDSILKKIIVTCCDQNSFSIKPKNGRNIFIHEEFVRGTGLNNIALIKIPKTQVKSNCRQPIPLLCPCDVEEHCLLNTSAVSTIYNTTERNIPKDLPGLSRLLIDFIPNSDCNEIFRRDLDYNITDSHVCILSSDISTIQYVNQPIVIKDCENKWVLVGITIQTLPEYNGLVAGTRISQYLNWIEKTTKGSVMGCSSINCDVNNGVNEDDCDHFLGDDDTILHFFALYNNFDDCF